MNTRKDNNGKALKAWRAIPPGHIAKPLRHIVARNSTLKAGENGAFSRVLGPLAMLAHSAAAAGRGDEVQRIARSLP